MGCRELDITSYYRFTEPCNNPQKGNFTPAPKKSHRGFYPVVSVAVSNYRYYSHDLMLTQQLKEKNIKRLEIYQF